MIKQIKTAAYWISLFVGYMLAIILTGTIAGAISYPLVGALLSFNDSILYMIQKGVEDLSFFALVWAPGSAIVLCFIKAHRSSSKG